MSKQRKIVVGLGLVAGLLGGSVASASLVSGLVAYYQFEDSYQDGSTSGYHATAPTVAAPNTNDPEFVAGKFGKALSLDGTGDYLSAGNVSGLNFGSNSDFTVAFWWKAPNQVDNNVGLVGKKLKTEGNASNSGFMLYLSTKKDITVQFAGGGVFKSQAIGSSTANVSDDAWHHIVLTVDRTAGRSQFYIDGAAKGTALDISAVGSLDSTTDFTMGRLNSGSASRTSGLMDDVAIWNRKLSTSEITDLMTHSIPEPGSLALLLAGVGLVAGKNRRPQA